jgi:hypothetical protein
MPARYLACGPKLLNRMTNRSVRIPFGESPAEAPDTVTYSFTSGALGSRSAIKSLSLR